MLQATLSVCPITISGMPVKPTPLTSSSPGMVRWVGHQGRSPSHFRCGLATFIPRPVAVTLRPRATALLPGCPMRSARQRDAAAKAGIEGRSLELTTGGAALAIAPAAADEPRYVVTA